MTTAAINVKAFTYVHNPATNRVEARILGGREYDWWQWDSNSEKTLTNTASTARITLTKGSIFGLRPARSKKGKFRLVTPEMGLTKVFTLDAKGAAEMMTKSRFVTDPRKKPVMRRVRK